MSNVIPFPRTVAALGFTFPAAVLRAGIEAAQHLGIGEDRIGELMASDRPFAVYFLSHLGSNDEQDQQVGRFGLQRLVGNLGGAV